MSSERNTRIRYALVPFLVIAVGIIFKLAFIDSVPNTDQYDYMIANYLRPLWIELSVSAYMLSAGVLLTNITKISHEIRSQIFWVPIWCFIACVLSALVLPKFGVNHELNTGWLPALLGLGAFAWVGYLITGVSE